MATGVVLAPCNAHRTNIANQISTRLLSHQPQSPRQSGQCYPGECLMVGGQSFIDVRAIAPVTPYLGLDHIRDCQMMVPTPILWNGGPSDAFLVWKPKTFR